MSVGGSLVHVVSGHAGDVNDVAFNQDTLASCSSDKTIRLWNLEDFSELACSPLCGHLYSVHCCVFSPNGAILASCSTDGKCILWDGKNGTKLCSVQHLSNSSVRICRFSPNGKLLATGSDDEKLCIWDVATRRLLRTFDSHDASVICCTFSPDGEFVVSGSTKGDIRVWDALYGHNKHLFLDLEAHDLGVTCCQFSPTYGSAGNLNNNLTCQLLYMLASGGFDNNVKLWDFLAYTGSSNVQLQLRSSLAGHTGPVLQLNFMSDGRVLATASGDKSIRLWDPVKGLSLNVLEGHSRFVTSCSFSWTDEYLATGSNDKMVKIWHVTRQEHPQLAEEPICYSDVSVVMPPAAAEARATARDWSIDDVCRWLMEIGMAQYADTFRKQAIDGTELLVLNQKIVEKDLGIGALGHRNKILRAIQNIKDHPEIQQRLNDDGAPDEYLCPITREMMMDPVIASDGYTYERAAISSWMSSGKLRSPMTNAVLLDNTLTPNRSLKMLIQRHVHAGST